MKLFKCQHCGQVLYFENSSCLGCQRKLGYVPDQALLTAVDRAGDGTWMSTAMPGRRFKACENAAFDACNWLMPANEAAKYCQACRHNHVVPDLSLDANLQNWRKLEIAKHHMVYSLLRLDLPITTRQDDPAGGLAFDFLSETATAGGKILTGHDDGLITLNLNEADDAKREALRQQMGEPYRTLLGHFRHEIGHYYWDRLVRDERRLEECRAVFGDERADYDQALRSYYANGPAANWQNFFISAYATAHPWEDFAETWAHYMHIVDTLEMAASFGIAIHPALTVPEMFAADIAFDPYQAGPINQLVTAWLPLAQAVNGINRCMGQPDLYPFVLTEAVIGKMAYIHGLVHAQRGAADAPTREAAMPAGATTPVAMDAPMASAG
jgi:hypothetical protein